VLVHNFLGSNPWQEEPVKNNQCNDNRNNEDSTKVSHSDATYELMFACVRERERAAAAAQKIHLALYT
jgi:hypothetical protein